MPRDIMSEQQININFVKEVQKHPTLYNFELPSYSRKDLTDMAWEEVGAATNMTPSACRERWRNLRAVFMRTIKAGPNSTGKKKPYYLADVMQFVIPFMRPLAMTEAAKEKQQQIQQEKAKEETEKSFLVEIDQIKVEHVDEDDSDEMSTTCVSEERDNSVKAAKKRPLNEEERFSPKVAKLPQPSTSTMPDSDHVKSFLNSLLPELTEMNSIQFKNFKRRVLLLIDDIVTEYPSTRQTDN